MNHSVIFLVFLLLTAASTIAQDDVTSTVSSSGGSPAVGRIIGGTDVPFGTYPWFAKPRMGDDWGGLLGLGCGGMLVAKEWVLTAAQCVVGVLPAFEIGAICHDEYDYSSNGNCGQPSEVINTIKILSHPDFNLGFDNDFALVKLASAASATPVNMDLSGVVRTYNSNSSLWAIGFGDRTYGLGRIPGRLQHVNLKFVPQSTCASNYVPVDLYYDFDVVITDNMLCAADEGKGSCYGDSGGPLYDAINNVVVGVVSFGNGCAEPGFPDVYSKIFAQREWIVDTICSDSTVPPSFCSGYTLYPTLTPSPSASPTTSASPTALCFEVSYWFDIYGNNCEWYAAKDGRCDAFSDSYYPGTNGLTANEACCACGGGTTTPPRCNDTPGWVDSFDDSCRWYELSRMCFSGGYYVGTDGQTANEACCVCGGGTTVCEDDLDFTFQLKNGKTRNCAWFTKLPDSAPIRKSRYCGDPNILNACSETCGLCDGTCYDNPRFNFVLDDGQGRDCEWLTKKPEQASDRISRYCERYDVSVACRETCGTCDLYYV